MAIIKQYPFWKGILPCFESGKEYLNWIQNYSSWSNTVPEKYESYFLEIGNAVRLRQRRSRTIFAMVADTSGHITLGQKSGQRRNSGWLPIRMAKVR